MPLSSFKARAVQERKINVKQLSNQESFLQQDDHLNAKGEFDDNGECS